MNSSTLISQVSLHSLVIAGSGKGACGGIKGSRARCARESGKIDEPSTEKTKNWVLNVVLLPIQQQAWQGGSGGRIWYLNWIKISDKLDLILGRVSGISGKRGRRNILGREGRARGLVRDPKFYTLPALLCVIGGEDELLYQCVQSFWTASPYYVNKLM